MSCGTGCTDCPTCRGEVQPDAPVMHDMRFAMAMAQGPMYEDGFLGPLSVAQTVRDGVRRRGQALASDGAVISFLMQVVRGPSVPRHIAPVSSGRVDRALDTSSMFDDNGGDGPVAPAAPTQPRERTPQELEWGKTEVESPLEKPPTGGERKPECGVKAFEYPECWYPIWSFDDSNLNIGLFFKAHMIYIPKTENPKYDCSCCEFRQYAEVEAKLPWISEDTIRTPKPVEDCVVTVDVEKEGKDGKKRTVREARALPILRGVAPKEPWDEFLANLPSPTHVCTGRRKSPGEDETYVGDPPTSCDYSYRDAPQLAIPRAHLHSGWKYDVTYIGRVVDICHGEAIRAEGRFSYHVDLESAKKAVSDPEHSTPGFSGGPPKDKQSDKERCK